MQELVAVVEHRTTVEQSQVAQLGSEVAQPGTEGLPLGAEGPNYYLMTHHEKYSSGIPRNTPSTSQASKAGQSQGERYLWLTAETQ